MLGRWCIECKAYGSGAEPRPDWWDQVLASSKADNLRHALDYKIKNLPSLLQKINVLKKY